MYASESGNIEIIKLLLKQKEININLKDIHSLKSMFISIILGLYKLYGI